MSEYLYIDRKESVLTLKGNAIQINLPDRPPASVPLHMLKQVTIASNVQLSSQLIHKLCTNDIGITIINQRTKTLTTDCICLQHGNTRRRFNQYVRLNDKAFCLTLSKQLVARKIRSQIRQINRYKAKRPELLGRLDRSQNRIKSLTSSIEKAGYQELLGIEGAASREYFAAYTRMLPDNLEFAGRNRRPPRDPVNCLLSICYGMLTSDCGRALAARGLDPAFGFYHQISYGRPSLACDLVEIFRTEVDHFVWRLCAEQIIRTHHFTKQLQACVLTKEGKQIFFPQWEFTARKLRRRIAKMVDILSRIADQEAENDNK